MKARIEIFSSPGCSQCKRAARQILEMLREISESDVEIREVNVLEDLEYALEVGVYTTPAIAVNGRLVYSGLPKRKELQSRLREALKQEGK